MTIEIVDLPSYKMVIFHRLLMLFVCLPEGTPKKHQATSIPQWRFPKPLGVPLL